MLRVVHSGLLGDDWQDEYDALRAGWPFHLNTLREYSDRTSPAAPRFPSSASRKPAAVRPPTSKRC